MFEKMTEDEIRYRLTDHTFDRFNYPDCTESEYEILNDRLYDRVCKMKPNCFNFDEIVDEIKHEIVQNVGIEI